ncbi:MAG TPA: DNA topoisomerase, partial [Bacteroidales bacterium]|nr:DNA topoisomerase [Bacteroidales bacterium]
VGFELSPILWKKVKPKLSAGRVQSVAVRLIVEKEEEIRNFQITTSFKVIGIFNVKSSNNKINTIEAELNKKFNSKEETIQFLEKCKTAQFYVSNIEIKDSSRSPAPPFITSTLQQEAARKLGFSVSKTMLIAQQLYESGKITYMRTDSLNLSDTAIKEAQKNITKDFGKEYLKIRKYTSKVKGAQEAHEAIRPTYLSKKTLEEGTTAQKKLYELIWKRTIASQMNDAQIEKTTITISMSNTDEKFIAKGEVIKFDGFLKLYIESNDEENNENENKTILPKVFKGDTLTIKEIIANQKFSQHPPRYTEASLVKKLEELGIGRPSTYAPIIETIQKRGYVIVDDKKGLERQYISLKLINQNIKEELKKELTGTEKAKLCPTDIGIVVNKFLITNFPSILDYNFTANIEKQFDEIAEGLKIWHIMIKEFYESFHPLVQKTMETTKKVSGEKLLGKDPVSGQNVYVKIGKYGPLVQIGDSESDQKPKFAGLLKNQSIETITLKEALDLFKFPKKIGLYENQEILVGIGRFGPYIKHGSNFYSLRKTDDPMTIDIQTAIEIILDKRKKNSEKIILKSTGNDDIKIIKGKWGPYISKGNKNYKIPKNVDPYTLTIEDCKNIINEIEAKSNIKNN